MTDWQQGEDVRIEGERIVIRTMNRDDVDDHVVGWFADPVVMNHIAMATGLSIRRIRRLVSRQDNETYFMLGVFLKESELQIGWVRIRTSRKIPNITWAIGDRSCWGKGYGKEMGAAVVRFLFEAFDVHKLTMSSYGENETAHAMNMKIGFRRECVRREHVRDKDGEWHDLHVFGLLAEEWRDGVARFRQASNLAAHVPSGG